MTIDDSTPLAKAVQQAAARARGEANMSGLAGGRSSAPAGLAPDARWDKIIEAIEQLERRVQALEGK